MAQDEERERPGREDVAPGGAGGRTSSTEGADKDPGFVGPRAYAGELIGTFLLVFFVTLVVSVVAGGSPSPDFAVIGLVHFALLAFLIYTLGDLSGAHFNPAVTLALLTLRKISPRNAAIYVVVQLVGGLLGALLTRALVPDAGDKVAYGATLVSDRLLAGGTLGAFVVELMATFALMWAIMGVAVNPRGRDEFAGLIIGATLGFAVMVVAPLTGASLNPARSFGPAVVSGEFGGLGTFVVAYVLGPVLGALAAATIYQALVIGPQERLGDTRPVDLLG